MREGEDTLEFLSAEWLVGSAFGVRKACVEFVISVCFLGVWVGGLGFFGGGGGG